MDLEERVYMDKNVRRVNEIIKKNSKGDLQALDQLYIEFGGLLYLIASIISLISICILLAISIISFQKKDIR